MTEFERIMVRIFDELLDVQRDQAHFLERLAIATEKKNGMYNSRPKYEVNYIDRGGTRD